MEQDLVQFWVSDNIFESGLAKQIELHIRYGRELC